MAQDLPSPGAIYGTAASQAQATVGAGLPSLGDLYGQSQQQLKGYGQQEMADLKQSYASAMGMAQQSLASTGLAGTTIAPSMRLGYMRQYSDALNRLHESLAQQRLQQEATFGLGGQQQAQQAQQAAAGIGLQGTGQQLQGSIASGQLALGYAENQTQRDAINARNNAYNQQPQAFGQSDNSGYNWQPEGFQAGGGMGTYSDLFSG